MKINEQYTKIKAHRWLPFYFQMNIFNLILESMTKIIQFKAKCQSLKKIIQNFSCVNTEVIQSVIPIIYNVEDKVQKFQKNLDILNQNFFSYHQHTMNAAHSFFLFQLTKNEKFISALSQLQIKVEDLKIKKYLKRYIQTQYHYLGILSQFPLQILDQQIIILKAYNLKLSALYQPPEHIVGALDRNSQIIKQIVTKLQTLYQKLFSHLNHIPRIKKPYGLFKRWFIPIALNIIVLVIIISGLIFGDVSRNQRQQFMNDFCIWRGSISYILYLWTWTCGLYFFQSHNIFYWMTNKKQRKGKNIDINCQQLLKITIFLNSAFTILFFFYMLFMAKIFSSSIFHPKFLALIMQFIMFLAFAYFNLARGQFQFLKLNVCFNIFVIKQIISLVIPFRDFIFSCCSIFYSTSDCRLNLTVNSFHLIYVLLCLLLIIIALAKQNECSYYKITCIIFSVCYSLLSLFGFLNQINFKQEYIYAWISICIMPIIVYILRQCAIQGSKSNQSKRIIIFSNEYLKIFHPLVKLFLKLICHFSFCLIISFNILISFSLLIFFAQCVVILAIGIQNIIQLEIQYISGIQQFQSIPNIQMDIKIDEQIELKKLKDFLEKELQKKQAYEKEQLNMFYFEELEQNRMVFLKELAVLEMNLKQAGLNQNYFYDQIGSI